MKETERRESETECGSEREREKEREVVRERERERERGCLTHVKCNISRTIEREEKAFVRNIC